MILDGREIDEDILCEFRSKDTVSGLCDRKTGIGMEGRGRIGSDGLMILSKGKGNEYDFEMEFYNPDGSGGMMCGNGGRCIAAFADHIGIKPAAGGNIFHFKAPDGEHEAEILSRESADRSTVRLKMIDAFGFTEVLGGSFLNTGTRHFVLFVDDVENTDVEKEGSALRHNEIFAPEGANVNFVSLTDKRGVLKIRTFEKGVEAETLACGTGIVASAIAANRKGISPREVKGDIVSYTLKARTESLMVDFKPVPPTSLKDVVATEVFLTGPAERE